MAHQFVSLLGPDTQIFGSAGEAHNEVDYNAQTIASAPVDIRYMVLMSCPFKHKLMLIETCRGFRETTRETEWQRDVSDIRQVYNEAKSKVRKQQAKEFREFRNMLLKMVAFFILSMVVQAGVGIFCVYVASTHADAPCDQPLAAALHYYGSCGILSWLLQLCVWFLQLCQQIMSCVPRRIRNLGEEKKFFDMEAGAPLLDQDQDDEDFQLSPGVDRCRRVSTGILKFTRGIVGFVAMYFYILIAVYTMRCEECDEWLYDVSWFLSMLPVFVCCCCCVGLPACFLAFRLIFG